MRVIKDEAVQYESFKDSLQYLTKTITPGNDELQVKYVLDKDPHSSAEKFNYFFHNIFSFENEIKNKTNIDEVFSLFNTTIKRIITVKESVIFLLNESENEFSPVIQSEYPHFTSIINQVYKKQKLNRLWENQQPQFIPETAVVSGGVQKLNSILFPIVDNEKKKGFLHLLTPVKYFNKNGIEQKLINLILNITLNKIENLKKKEEITNVYKELHSFQSKLSNDFKLSAIGELTAGVAEDILSPLQVIMTQADFIKETGSEERKIYNTINSQVKKIEHVVNRLIKFADVNNGISRIMPCNINGIIESFFALISSSLKNQNYEFILELEKDLPTIPSHPDYLNQLLSNIFQLIKSNSVNGGGILIQTKHQNQNIYLRIIVTENFKQFSNDSGVADDPNLRIINHLVKKHDGTLKISSNESEGTSIVIVFPLNRKIK